jgi:membrane protease subunit (stomatin/prohibitin family)
MKERIEPTMDEYGIKLVNFYVNDISVPEDDPAVAKLKDALAKRAEMNIIGYSYQQERSFDTLEGAAKNNSASSAPLMGAGIGLGMGVGLGGAVGGAFGGVASEINTKQNTTTKECPKCHARIDVNQRFCGSCGFDTENNEKEKVKIVCSTCGAELNGKSKFCPECGKKYNPCPECGADVPEGVTTCPECGIEPPMKCSRCGVEVPKGAKFCPECGESFVKKCPKCGVVIEGDSKFCLECGEKLK